MKSNLEMKVDAALDAALRKFVQHTSALTPLTVAQQQTADDVAQRWQRWLDDPDHNPAPCRKANTARLREWKAAQPEQARQAREHRNEGVLADYAP